MTPLFGQSLEPSVPKTVTIKVTGLGTDYVSLGISFFYITILVRS